MSGFGCALHACWASALMPLLQVGGAWLPAAQRLAADALCLDAAQGVVVQTTVQAVPGRHHNQLQGRSEATQAALQALLTAVLVPCCHQPPFLAQALSLFRQVRAPRHRSYLDGFCSTPAREACLVPGSATVYAGSRCHGLRYCRAAGTLPVALPQLCRL